MKWDVCERIENIRDFFLFIYILVINNNNIVIYLIIYLF